MLEIVVSEAVHSVFVTCHNDTSLQIPRHLSQETLKHEQDTKLDY